MEKSSNKGNQKANVKTLGNKGGTLLEKPKADVKKNEKAKVTKPEVKSTEFKPFQGKGQLIGSDFEQSKKSLDDLVDIYSSLGK